MTMSSWRLRGGATGQQRIRRQESAPQVYVGKRARPGERAIGRLVSSTPRWSEIDQPALFVASAAVALLCVTLIGAVACGAPAAENEAVPRVRAATVRRGPIEERVELQARLVPPPELDATLAPQVAGRLVAVPVREGQVVAAGELLAEVDDRAPREARRTAEAELIQAQSEETARARIAEVTRSLFTKGIAAAEEKNADEATAAAATAARVAAEGRQSEARRMAGWTRLTAPFRGVVAQLLRHQGETVDGTPATPVVRLAGLDRTEAEARATAAQIRRLLPGAPVEVRAGESRWPAHLVRVARAVDPVTGLGEVRAELDSPADYPLFADVRLDALVERHADALVVPVSALRRSEAGVDEVVVLDHGTVQARAVEIGIRTATEVEIRAGLAPGEVIATDPLGLEEGATVEIATEDAAAAP